MNYVHVPAGKYFLSSKGRWKNKTVDCPAEAKSGWEGSGDRAKEGGYW